MNLNQGTKTYIGANLIAAVLLFVGMASLPYIYYQFLRIAVPLLMGASLFGLWTSESKGTLTNVAYVALAAIIIIFNPILPLYSDKETWVIIDGVCGAVLALFSAVEYYKNN